MVQIVLNIENTYLYLTHESKDAIKKNKYKYDKADIKHINNFDIDRYLTLDAEQRRYSRRGLQYYCRSSASEYLGIEKFCNGKRFRVWTAEYESYQFCSTFSHTGLIRLYFDGVYQERKYGNLVPSVDYETGEVLSEEE